MIFSILTLFPAEISPLLNSSILKNAQRKNLVLFNIVNIRDFATDKRRSVDDKPFGGGVGMVMRVDIVVKALEHTITRNEKIPGNKRLILLTEAGADIFTQSKAKEYTQYDHIIIICGHYEGIDARIHNYITASISIGEFVLTGGEIPALTIVDAVTRLIPGVLKKSDATTYESYSQTMKKEYPQYTRPENFRGDKVPEILLSGNHKEISKWQKEKSIS